MSYYQPQKFLFLFIWLIASCDTNDKASLPSSTGKAGEIIVVIENKHWISPVGALLKDYLAKQHVALPQPEPLFDLINIPPASFTGIFKNHRNILLIDITVTEDPSFVVKSDFWAKGQLVIKITAPDEDFITAMLNRKKEALPGYFINVEKERLMRDYAKIEVQSIRDKLLKNHSLSLTIPAGFEIAKEAESFVWIRRETEEMSQGILLYYYNYVDFNSLNKEHIISMRDSITKQYIAGPLEGSYMATMREYPAVIKEFRFNEHYAVETRGLWNVHGDFMGGPFLSYTVFDEHNNRVITVDGYVYAPKFNKRNYLRQVEAILYSLKFQNP